jgi:Ni,Fe-hydrogenase III small subunit
MLANLSKKLFGKSLWIYHCNTGACNGCDIEISHVLTPYYDVERFGMKLCSLSQACRVMLLSGAVTRPTLPLVKKAYDALPEPKLVFGVGSCRNRRWMLV